MSLDARACGGHLVIEFAADTRVEDGVPVLGLTPHRFLWDGEEVPDVVAEALRITWWAAQPDA